LLERKIVALAFWLKFPRSFTNYLLISSIRDVKFVLKIGQKWGIIIRSFIEEEFYG